MASNKTPDPVKPEILDQLSQDWMNVFSSKEFSDVQIHCGDQVFDCHQVVLAARSPVFRAMFQSNMLEKNTRRIEVPDLRPEVVSDMLTFMYTGKTPNLDQLVEDLLTAADKYQLDQLKSVCVENLCKKIDVENCIGVLILGDNYQTDQFRKSSLQFIERNRRKIFKSKNWEEKLQPYPHLMAEVIRTLALAGPEPRVHENITQKIVWVEEKDKKQVLLDLIRATEPAAVGEVSRTLVFVETDTCADHIAYNLLSAEGFPATTIPHYCKDVQEEALKKFKTGQFPILVTTTSTAEVLDIPPVKHVIQFHLPKNIKKYIHRTSYTGRKESPGLSTSFFNNADSDLAEELKKVLVESIQEIPSWMESYVSNEDPWSRASFKP